MFERRMRAVLFRSTTSAAAPFFSLDFRSPAPLTPAGSESNQAKGKEKKEKAFSFPVFPQLFLSLHRPRRSASLSLNLSIHLSLSIELAEDTKTVNKRLQVTEWCFFSICQREKKRKREKKVRKKKKR